MSWAQKNLHHNTCVHQIRMGDGSWKECGVTIEELDGRPHGWTCPMHDRQVQAATNSLRKPDAAVA